MFPEVYGSVVRLLERLMTLVAGILTVRRHPVLVEQTLSPRGPVCAAARVGAVAARTCVQIVITHLIDIFKTLRFGICPFTEFYICSILITVIAFPCAHTYFPQKINAKRYLIC